MPFAKDFQSAWDDRVATPTIAGKRKKGNWSARETKGMAKDSTGQPIWVATLIKNHIFPAQKIESEARDRCYGFG
jgi:hypothetical protein